MKVDKCTGQKPILEGMYRNRTVPTWTAVHRCTECILPPLLVVNNSTVMLDTRDCNIVNKCQYTRTDVVVSPGGQAHPHIAGRCWKQGTSYAYVYLPCCSLRINILLTDNRAVSDTVWQIQWDIHTMLYAVNNLKYLIIIVKQLGSALPIHQPHILWLTPQPANQRSKVISSGQGDYCIFQANATIYVQGAILCYIFVLFYCLPCM